MTGTIVTWISHKGFGFIRPDGADPEIFFHITGLPTRRPIPVDTRVTFDLTTYGSRIKAINVRPEGAK